LEDRTNIYEQGNPQYQNHGIILDQPCLADNNLHYDKGVIMSGLKRVENLLEAAVRIEHKGVELYNKFTNGLN